MARTVTLRLSQQAYEAVKRYDGNLSVPGIPPAPDPALLDTYELTDPARAAW